MPQVEEVTYAEPVLLPQPPPKMHSPKSTLRKPMPPHHGPNSETFFQFQPDGYNTQQSYRCRDNFGTLRSHQVMVRLKINKTIYIYDFYYTKNLRKCILKLAIKFAQLKYPTSKYSSKLDLWICNGRFGNYDDFNVEYCRPQDRFSYIFAIERRLHKKLLLSWFHLR